MNIENAKRRIRKITAFALALALTAGFSLPSGTEIMGVSFGSAIEASAAVFGDFQYTDEDGCSVTIISYRGSGGDVVIPDNIDGYPVTAIGDSAFNNCTTITRLTIPDSVTYISNMAFVNCTSLTSIAIPQGVTYIGEQAFIDCYSLESVTFGENSKLENIGDYVFAGCESLTSIAIPQGVTSISNGTFYNNFSLESITIPNSVTSIGNDAFLGCESLTSITIPDSVTSIGEYAFEGCESLTGITIPDSVTSIGEYAFEGCEKLTSIAIPQGVTSIGNAAFSSCSRLESIFLPDSAIDITNAEIPDSAAQIKYTLGDEYFIIKKVTLGTGQTTVIIPERISDKPVYFADWSLESCPDVSHTHREQADAGTEKPVCAICLKEFEHSFTEYVPDNNATCTENGTETAKCDSCDKTHTREIPDSALGHDHSGEWQMNETEHWRVCARSGCSEKLDTAPHTEDSGTITKLPTETTKGEKTYKCTECGYVIRTEEIPALEHTHSLETEYSSNASGHWHACSGCDERVDFEAHTEDSGTVTTAPTETAAGIKTFKCTKCGYVIRREAIPAEGSGNSYPYPINPVYPAYPTYPTSPAYPIYSVYPAYPSYSIASSLFNENLTVDAEVSGSTINLSWNEIKNADKYIVYLYRNGKYVRVRTTSEASAEFTNIRNGESCSFMVRYTVKGRLSPAANSGKCNVKVYYKPIPKAASDANSVRLTWNAVPDAKNYAVYKYADGKAVKLGETDKLSVKIGRLSPDKEYKYIVRAFVDGKWTAMTKSDIVTVNTKAE